jgi:hypoxanthine phosphoribosyltransferase
LDVKMPHMSDEFNPPRSYYDWDEIMYSILGIGRQMRMLQYEPDLIVGIRRGGVIPSIMLSLYVSSKWIELFYPCKEDSDKAETHLHRFFEPIRGSNILLLDDISDTGKTFKSILPTANDYCEVKTSCVIQNFSSQFITDFYGDIIDKGKVDQWVVFPWERDYGDEI